MRRTGPLVSNAMRLPAVGTTRPSRSTTLTVTTATSSPPVRSLARSTLSRTALPLPVVATVCCVTSLPAL